MNIKSIILLIVLLFALSSCINLKTPYPAIEYYRLNQEPTAFKNTGSISGSLQIRNFTAREDLNSDQLVATIDSTKLHRYFYHRWAADCPDLVTDFFIQRLSNLKAFSGGVFKTATIAIPEYILEGQILEMIASNSTTPDLKNNFATVSLKITLIKRLSDKYDKLVILNKTYNNKILRPDNEVTSIAPAFSKAYSQITDKIMFDIQEAVSRHRLEEENPEK